MLTFIMEYSRENWNFYIEPKVASYLDAMELTQNANEQELSEIDIDRLESLANLMGDYKEMQYTYTINA